MRVLYVIECDVPSPEQVAMPLAALNPPSLPYFKGKVRVVIEPHATELLDWLDEE